MPFVELIAPEGRSSLVFEDEKQQAQFELGVSSAIFLWDDLSYLVDSSLGGSESQEKREWLAGSIVDLFNSKEVSSEDIEERLVWALEDEFDTVLETNSAHHLAEQICDIYQWCTVQQYGEILALYEKYQKQQAAGPRQRPAMQSADGSSSEESSDEDEDDGDEEMVVEPKGAQEPIVDEDGFTVVQRRRK